MHGMASVSSAILDVAGTPHDVPPPAHENDCELGELLRRAREGRGLTRQQISSETKIPLRLLEALERNSLTELPGGFYRRAQIRAYARAVHLDEAVASAQLARALTAAPDEVTTPQRTQEPTWSQARLMIIIGIVVAAGVTWWAFDGREPRADRQARMQRPSQSVRHRVAPPPEMSLGAVAGLSQRALPDQPIASIVFSDGGRAMASASTNGRAAALPSDDVRDAAGAAPAPSSTDSDTSGLVVTTEPPGARVTMNGIGWGFAPVTIRYVAPGDKRIRVTKDGYEAEERLVHLAEGHAKALTIRLRAAP